jgi:hypothetical protein
MTARTASTAWTANPTKEPSMPLTFVVARLLHILLGAFWAGTLIFNALFLAPALGEAGPDGAKVMAGVQRRRFMDIMPIVALLTIVTGIWLYWRQSGGFSAGWSRSPMGIGYGAGGILAIVAFGIGVGVLRPAMSRIGTLAASAGQVADQAQREALMAQMAALRRRSTTAGRLVALLLALATALMGVARYLG